MDNSDMPDMKHNLSTGPQIGDAFGMLLMECWECGAESGRVLEFVEREDVMCNPVFSDASVVASARTLTDIIDAATILEAKEHSYAGRATDYPASRLPGSSRTTPPN